MVMELVVLKNWWCCMAWATFSGLSHFNKLRCLNRTSFVYANLAYSKERSSLPIISSAFSNSPSFDSFLLNEYAVFTSSKSLYKFSIVEFNYYFSSAKNFLLSRFSHVISSIFCKTLSLSKRSPLSFSIIFS